MCPFILDAPAGIINTGLANFIRRIFQQPQPSYQTLQDFNVAFCIYDRDLVETPLEVTTDYIYIRLHGSGPTYGGKYQTKHLEAWAKRIQEWKKQHRDIWFYFNNDWQGYAINNALELKRLVQTK